MPVHELQVVELAAGVLDKVNVQDGLLLYMELQEAVTVPFVTGAGVGMV